VTTTKPEQAALRLTTVAAYLSVTDQTVHRWVEAGTFPIAVRLANGRYAIDPDGLVTWLRSRYLGRPGPPAPTAPLLDADGRVANPLLPGREVQRLLRVTSTQLRWLIDSGQAGAYDLTSGTLRYDTADPSLRATRRQRARVRREPRREPIATLLDRLADGPLDPNSGEDLDLAAPAALHAAQREGLTWSSVVPLDVESIGLAYVLAALSSTYFATLTGSHAADLGLPSPAKHDKPLAVTWQGVETQQALDALRRPRTLGITTVVAISAPGDWVDQLQGRQLKVVVVVPALQRSTPPSPMGARPRRSPPREP
jgi:predicted DNA-binding transcriptional regulator AlpA